MSSLRELTVRIRFTKEALGNQKTKDGRFLFARDPSTDNILFLAAAHRANLRVAADLLGRHQDEVLKIHWDVNIDGKVLPNSWYKSYHQSSKGGKQRYTLHECFKPGTVIGINCAVPTAISDEDFWKLMSKAGQYRGLSPWRPMQFGHFAVVSVRPRRNVIEEPTLDLRLPREAMESQIVE